MHVIRNNSYKQNKRDPRVKPYRDYINFISEIDGIMYIGEDIIVIPEDLSATVTDSMHKLLGKLFINLQF